MGLIVEVLLQNPDIDDTLELFPALVPGRVPPSQKEDEATASNLLETVLSFILKMTNKRGNDDDSPAERLGLSVHALHFADPSLP